MKLKQTCVAAVSTVVLTGYLTTPAKASLLPTNIDFGSLGGFGDFGSIGGIVGDLGINLPDISTVLDDVTSIIPDISIGGIEDIFDIDLGGLGGLGDILGDMGLPDIGGIFDTILGDILGGNCFMPTDCPIGTGGETGNPGTPGSNSPGSPTAVLGGAAANITPGVNPTVAVNVDAISALTEATAAIGLSEEGQAATKTRLDAAATGADNSQALVDQSIQALAQQAEAAGQVVTSTNEQTSTQDVLKTALSGLVQLQVATSSQVAYGRQQDAISTQLSLLDLHFAREQRDGTFVNGKNLQLVNQQLNQSLQRDIAEESGVVSDTSRTLRLVHVPR
ncbi:MAG: hypothetical protein AAF329_03650 [Cyanobacteria bacterium P01_A01_bin.17]